MTLPNQKDCSTFAPPVKQGKSTRMISSVSQIKYFFFLFAIPLLLSSCFTSKKVAYFQNATDSLSISSPDGLEATIQKDDILSIIVSSLSNEATLMFNTPNLPITPNVLDPRDPQTAGYLVDKKGYIKFPVLGEIKAQGLTPRQLEKEITDGIVKKNLLFDPVVNARFLNFRVTVLGEVNRPGVVFANGGQISILEAIGLAGDLTIYGLRDNVLLIRQEGNQKITRRLDLTSANILNSPYYYLKSNDVLYVQPGRDKVVSSDAALRILPVIFSGVSVIVVVLTSLLR